MTHPNKEKQLRYFIAYHNEEKIGAPCATLPYPRVRTKKPVDGLEGSTVWLIAGVGKSPKSYYVASRFTINKCECDKYLGQALNNEVSGDGHLFGLSIPIDATPLLAELKRQSANFVSGFCQISDPTIISALKALKGTNG